MRFFNKIIIISSILFSLSFGQIYDPGEVSGVFLTLGVGPRFPIGDLGSQHTIGAGFDVQISYTDNKLAPLFFYLDLGYQNHPGDYDYYKISDHSSITSNIVSFHLGSRYFLEPLLEDIILLMPIIEGGITYSYVEKYHEYKIDTGKPSNLVGISNLGFHVGGGISFFLMDLIASYNYLQNNQYISFNLRLTIPLAITL